MTADELIENFSLFDDWEDRYRYLIDLGRALPDLDPALRTGATKVEGCMSQVWLVPSIGTDGRFGFVADSDSHIVKGLIAVLRVIYAGLTPAEVLDTDIAGIFGRLGLHEHLSPNRRNGFQAMVERIRQAARAAQAA